MSEQNDNRISPLKTIIEEIEGVNFFIKEMLEMIGNDPQEETLTEKLIEALLATGCIEHVIGNINESVEDTESVLSMEVEEIERFFQCLNVMADCLDTFLTHDLDTMIETIDALQEAIYDTKEKILQKYIQAKVGKMKQRIDQARSAVKGSKKAAVKDEVHDESKKFGDDKL